MTLLLAWFVLYNLHYSWGWYIGALFLWLCHWDFWKRTIRREARRPLSEEEKQEMGLSEFVRDCNRAIEALKRISGKPPS